MQKSKKQLLGMGGLALVVAGTAYAVSIPTPDADAASAGGETQITVQVYSGNPEVRITSISDGEIVTGSEITIGNVYSDAEKIEYILYKKTDSGNVYADLGENAVYIPANKPESGERAFDFDLNSSADLGYGEYILQVKLTSGSSVVEDTVSFRYAPLSISYVGNAENGDPIVELSYAANVASIDLQAYNSSGSALFDSALNYTVTNPGVAGTMRVTLPFLNYGASSGDYTISAVSKDANGTVLDSTVGPVYTTVKYTSPDSPAVPKTGDVAAKLNLSRADYLITGLIGFGLFTAFALYLLRRQRR